MQSLSRTLNINVAAITVQIDTGVGRSVPVTVKAQTCIAVLTDIFVSALQCTFGSMMSSGELFTTLTNQTADPFDTVVSE